MTDSAEVAWQHDAVGRVGGGAAGRIVRMLLSLVFPPACEYCGGELPEDRGRSELCDRCRDDLLGSSLPAQSFAGAGTSRALGAVRPESEGGGGSDGWGSGVVERSARPVCVRCGLPWRAVSVGRCLYCQRHGYRFDATFALGPYEGRLRRAVIRMKRYAEYPLTAAVGRLLGQRLRQAWAGDLPELIVPLPKHWWKRLRRGTNSAELLAECIGREMGRPVARGALRCRRLTRKQSLLTVEERRRNAAESLSLADRRDWSGRDILIVDDIMTTGATASEAARVFKRAGAARVRVAVVGRAFPSL